MNVCHCVASIPKGRIKDILRDPQRMFLSFGFDLKRVLYKALPFFYGVKLNLCCRYSCKMFLSLPFFLFYTGKKFKMQEKLTVQCQNLNLQTKEPVASGYKTEVWDVTL